VAFSAPGALGPSLLHVVEKFIGQDTIWHVCSHPFGFWIGSADAAPSLRVFDEALPIPADAADVECILQYPVRPLAAAGDRRSVPRSASWSGNSFLVQTSGNIPRRVSAHVGLENAPDHSSFVFHDLESAVFSCDRAVAVAAAAIVATVADDPGLSALGLLGKIFQI
jgi:hypothetical protein